MKYSRAHALASVSSPAPALARGLAVLVALSEQSPLSLEALAASLKLPKASVFRLLRTLQQTGMVRKNPGRSYEPLWALQLLADPRTRWRELLREPMESLSRETDCTLEWYEPSSAGMRMVEQRFPESEVRVQRRPGLACSWGEELDAVVRLGYAFAAEAPRATPSLKAYFSDGVRRAISTKEAVKRIETGRRERSAVDVYFNTMGVRRMAVTVFEQGQFVGVLALAEIFQFRRQPHLPRLELLRKVVERIS